MVKSKNTDSSSSPRKLRPALTPEAREKQLIALAIDVAEEQLINRTASSQVITHFLKLATSQAELEKEKLRQDIKLQGAKTEAIQSAKEVEKLYTEALNAMKRYSGQGEPYEPEDY